MIVTDEYINDLFKNTNFGIQTNECVNKKRDLVIKTLRNAADGYWVGHTAYHIVASGGFIVDGKKGEKKKLTALGELFCKQK